MATPSEPAALSQTRKSKLPPEPLQQNLDLIPLPRQGETRRFMAARAAYLPGSDIEIDGELPMNRANAFGGHVYGQSALAAAWTWREIERERGAKPEERLDLHTIHGFFTRPGARDRPFLYDVTPLTSTRTFASLSVIARQPTQSSTAGPAAINQGFPLADASLPLAQPAFTAMISLKQPEHDSAGVETQEEPPQVRFKEILESRRPEEWPPAPPVDLSAIVAFVGAHQEGRFPVAIMKKVDMRAWNRGKPLHERRELVLYKLHAPLPVEDEGKWDANAHVVAHAYVADRNGLLMVANNMGFGFTLEKAASLSYSFVMHVGAKEAVMREEEGWWVQELWFPRTGRGRGIVESKIWSPRGVHVATEYQDGMIRGYERGFVDEGEEREEGEARESKL